MIYGMADSTTHLPVVFLMGPTATGKTRLAVELVQQLPVDIISVDSAMVYRGMDIGTAKPAAEILKIAPHRLIDICDPVESYSAARFCHDAHVEIKQIHAAGRIPLLVGGTGLYFRALEKGLSELPPADTEIRQQLATEAKTAGWKTMHNRLAKIDPEAADKIHPNDPQRIQRALEVFALTGEPMSAHFGKNAPTPISCNVIKIVIGPSDRKDLHEQIRQRFLKMLDQGLVDEVRKLYARGDLNASLPAMRLVGYRQVWQYLAGQLDYKTMIDRAVVATRQLAKRQLTWFRREPGAKWFASQDAVIPANLLNYLADKITLSE
jgi:tRNA dimethylallyltransferase